MKLTFKEITRLCNVLFIKTLPTTKSEGQLSFERIKNEKKKKFIIENFNKNHRFHFRLMILRFHMQLRKIGTLLHTHTHIYIYIYIKINTHTHTHTHTDYIYIYIYIYIYEVRPD